MCLSFFLFSFSWIETINSFKHASRYVNTILGLFLIEKHNSRLIRKVQKWKHCAIAYPESTRVQN